MAPLARKRVTLRLERKWLLPGIVFLAGIAAFLIFGLPILLGPSLSTSQKEWKEFQGDDPKGFPLEVVRHGYRMIRVYRSEPQKAKGTRPAHLVEWEWKVTIQNRSSRDVEFYVNYFLVDQDHLLVDVDYMISPQPAPARETVTIQRKTEMVYEDLHRVTTGVWEIGWGQEKPSLKRKRKGF